MSDLQTNDQHNDQDSNPKKPGREDAVKMPPLNLPAVDLRIERRDGLIKVYDDIRDKFVALTPEEFVRQHFTRYLRDSLHYPASLMANEVGIEVNNCRRRCDTVIYNPDGSLLMIVEYKAPGVPVTQAVFDQIVRYNSTLRAKYLVVSNGIRHYCCVIDYGRDTYHFIPKIPDYKALKSPSEN